MNRFSLRARLVALAVLLVAFAVTAVGAATYVALHSYLYSRLDQQVVELAGDAQRTVCVPSNGPSQAADRAPYSAFVTDDAQVAQFLCTGYRLARPLGLNAGEVREMSTLTAATGPFTLHATDGGTYRVVASPQRLLVGSSLANATPTDGTLVLGLSAADAQATLSRLVALELIIGAAAVIGTAVLGTIGVRLGMRPLDRVTRTARTVAAELGPDGSGLENRVPGADPHTEVGQLSEAVNTMLDAVEREYAARYESEQRLRRFLADASHELRTPLTSLRGYAELVRMRGGLDPEASDSLRRIEAEGTRMSGLVEDLLTLARSDRGTVAERAPVDVAGVVDDAVAGLRAAYPQRQVSVTDRGPLTVLGDRNQLLQVVTNILTNAAVHATAPVPITVSAGQEGGEVVVRVVDGGPGLPPDQAAQVFDRFWRADAARTRVRGGSGLGMSIVAALVADHGGRVDFESTVEHGTTVTVRLPAAPVQAGPPPAAEPAPPATAPTPR
ncbi:MAG TPA: HAMP domain-containing sensor histidine kinase [Mycobacteriales bacterium]